MAAEGLTAVLVVGLSPLGDLLSDLHPAGVAAIRDLAAAAGLGVRGDARGDVRRRLPLGSVLARRRPERPLLHGGDCVLPPHGPGGPPPRPPPQHGGIGRAA